MFDAVQFGPRALIKRHKVFMMLSWTLTRLSLAVTAVVCLSDRSFAEQRLLCSSDSLSLWWEYEGPIVFTSLEILHCDLGLDKIIVSYTGMARFTMVQVGWHMSVLYKSGLWVELSQPLGPCEDLRICGLIKGETIHETLPVCMRPYATPDGEYQIILTANIIDDMDRELTLRMTSTLHLRNEK